MKNEPIADAATAKAGNLHTAPINANPGDPLGWRATGKTVRFRSFAIADMIYDGDGKADERAQQIADFFAARFVLAGEMPEMINHAGVIPDIPPLPATLDQFSAVVEVAKQLAEAANIPGPLRAKCVFLCRDAEEMIKRERAFATVGAELCARAILRRVLYKCPTNPHPANAYHPVNLSTEEIDEIYRIVHGLPVGAGVDMMRQAMGRIHREPGHSGKTYARPILGPAFQQPADPVLVATTAEQQAREAADLEIPQ